jgi:hypothetical protein
MSQAPRETATPRAVQRYMRLHRRLASRIARYPFATLLSLVSIPIGLLAVALGQSVSRSFTIVYAQPSLVYVWGAVMCGGGLAVLLGILRGTPSFELAGLLTLGLAFSFYGVSVLLGLGMGGLVAGPISLALGLACALRAWGIWIVARAIRAGDIAHAARMAERRE